MPKDRASFVPPALAARVRGTSLRRSLTDGLRRAIELGELSAGVRLPSSRGLAEDLGVSRGVVTDAYAQLATEGWIEQRPGARPVVRALPRMEPVVPAPPAAAWRYDLTPNAPDLAAFPRGAWVAAIRRVVTALPDAELDYPEARGPEAARRALAGYLARTRGAVTTADRLVVVRGFTHGLALTCRVLAAAGARRLAVEDPSLDDAWETIRRHGLEPVAVPVDGDGIVVEELVATGADAVLVTPAHQFPTGARLASGRRAALVAWAADTGATIIEDDYDGEHADPRAPASVLQALAPDRVILLGTVSKTLAPVLRLGWLVAPPRLVDPIADERWFGDSGGPAIDALALADLIERGELERHLRRTRVAYRARRRELLEALAAAGLRPLAPDVHAGVHLCAELPAGVDDVAVARELQAQRINVRALSPYRLRHPGPPGLVLGYGRVHERAVSAIAEAVWAHLPTRSTSPSSPAVRSRPG